jgi:hypothetical protein
MERPISALSSHPARGRKLWVFQIVPPPLVVGEGEEKVGLSGK